MFVGGTKLDSGDPGLGTYRQNCFQIPLGGNIVSDQPALARQLLEVATPKLKLNYLRGTSEIEDLSLISHSRGIVMSCSSFSWWGARLASINSSTQVVAPTNWLRNPSNFDSHMNYVNWKLLSKE